MAPKASFKTTKVTFGNHSFKARVADTEKDREKGLSGTAKLAPDEAMLFVMDSPSNACFWMKDMLYNLDIVWFDADRQLVYQKVNLPPSSYPNNYCSPQNAKYVLELPAGTLSGLSVAPNTPVYFDYKP